MQEYNICFSLDSNYVEQFAVSAVSILKNADKCDNINFYILDGGLNNNQKADIELLKNIKDFNIEYISIDYNDFKNCPMLKDKDTEHKDYHVTLPTYFRFKLASLLPDIDKLLYLDCDVIVRNSLRELFAVSLKDKAAAMVEDVESKKESSRLGIKQYFNAGVMLINLDYWRKNDIESKLFDYALNNADEILWQDQDVINIVLNEKIKPINVKWNYQYFLYENINPKKLSDCEILHLAGRFKPWLISFEHFVYDFYYYYLSLTPYKNKIFEYKLSAGGKLLKNNTGGSVTNILLNATSEDVHKIYEEINNAYKYVNGNNVQTDEKITKVYEEITRNYEYTNDLTNNLKNELSSLRDIADDNVRAAAAETDEKISKVYDDITKNYEYTNQIRDDINSRTEMLKDSISEKEKLIYERIKASEDNVSEKEKLIYERIKTSEDNVSQIVSDLSGSYSDKITHQTDEKISKVYEEITKNYEYTNELNKNVYNEISLIRDESANRAVACSSMTDEKISKVYEEITKNYEYTNNLSQDAKNSALQLQKNIDGLYADLNNYKDSLVDAKNGIYSYIDNSVEKVQNNAFEKIVSSENNIDAKISDFINAQNTSVNLRISELYSYSNMEFSKLFKILQQNNSLLENKLEMKLKSDNEMNGAVNNSIAQLQNDLNNKADSDIAEKLEKKFSEKIEFINNLHKNRINDLTSCFEKRLNDQKIIYESKLEKLETAIRSLEEESRRSFFQRVFGIKKKR